MGIKQREWIRFSVKKPVLGSGLAHRATPPPVRQQISFRARTELIRSSNQGQRYSDRFILGFGLHSRLRSIFGTMVSRERNAKHGTSFVTFGATNIAIEA